MTSGPGSWPRSRGGSATSTSPRTRRPRPSPPPSSTGPSTACHPTPAAGSPPRPATRPSTAYDVRAGGTRSRRRRRCSASSSPVRPSRSAPSTTTDCGCSSPAAHPALAMEARVALTLRMVGGLTVAEIAHAFLVQETTMAQRITRAKAKIRAAGIPYRVPDAPDLPTRVAGVLAVLYLVFNEGYLATGEDSDPVRAELTAEADPTDPAGARAAARRRGGRGTAGADAAHRGPPDGAGLRERRARHPRPTRTAGPGTRVSSRRAMPLVRERLASGRGARAATRCWPRSTPSTPTPATCGTPTGRRSSPSTTSSCGSTPHPSSCSTGRSRSPSSTARTSRWPQVDALAEPLDGYHAFHAARADLLRRLGRGAEARTAYDRAIGLAGNTAEAAYLTRRRDELAVLGPSPGRQGLGALRAQRHPHEGVGPTRPVDPHPAPQLGDDPAVDQVVRVVLVRLRRGEQA